MATPQQQAALHKEGRLELAIQAYKQGHFQSYRVAAKTYDVDPKTLQRRLAGVQPQLGSIPHNCLLTPTEEESLIQWILSMDWRSMPPRVATIWHMVGLLVAQHKKPASVGQNWVNSFIKQHDTLKSKYNHKYNYQ